MLANLPIDCTWNIATQWSAAAAPPLPGGWDEESGFDCAGGGLYP